MLYRIRENLGPQLTSVSDHYTALQLTKAQLLEHSVDANVRTLWLARQKREEKLRHWRVSQLSKVADAQVDLDLRRKWNFNSQPTVTERRKLVSTTALSFAEDKRMQHAQCLAQQGAWIAWHEQIIPFDLSWKNLIYGPGPHVIKFLLNGSVNWAKTPDMMKKYGYTQTAYCILCGCPQCTLHHIICNCKHARNGDRYTWRHDSVLLHLKPILSELVAAANKAPNKAHETPPIEASFMPKGETTKPPKRITRRQTLLDGFSDWILLLDLEDHKLVFPPEVYSTPLRPDIVIWSAQRQHVLMVELTCPAEEGIEAAQVRKEARYLPLQNEIKEHNPNWSTEVLTIEVGARGYVARTVPRCLKQLGLTPRKVNRVVKDLSTLAARCTYTIYLARENKGWDRRRPLLTAIDAASKARPGPTPPVPAANDRQLRNGSLPGEV